MEKIVHEVQEITYVISASEIRRAIFESSLKTTDGHTLIPAGDYEVRGLPEFIEVVYTYKNVGTSDRDSMALGMIQRAYELSKGRECQELFDILNDLIVGSDSLKEENFIKLNKKLGELEASDG